MSMYPQELGSIPAETMRVARAAYPKGSLAMRLRDELGGIYRDEQFVSLFPTRGQPAEAPWRLALVLVLQYVDGLTDRQAADAIRGRIDWKYALGLELTDAGIDASVLSEFRARVVAGGAEALLLDALLDVCKQRGWVKAGGKQRTDSTHVLARVRSLSNLEMVGETLRAVLGDLAQVDADWLAQQISAEWLGRYVHRVENYRLPKAESQRRALAEQIGADGLHLLRVLEQAGTPAQVQQVESVQLLRQVWQQYYEVVEGQARWRAGPQAIEDEGVIRSPYDAEARTGKKREIVWLGYKVHLTETCQTPQVEAEASEGQERRAAPQLIVQVQTTLANEQDVAVTASIQHELAQADLLPDEQIVDTGYVDGDLLVSSQREYGIRLLGPVLADTSWQAKDGKGFDLAHFQVDWQRQEVVCPQGQCSCSWLVQPDRIEARFALKTCAACPSRQDCTHATNAGRMVHLLPQPAHEALQARRAEQQTPEFREQYATRAGIEGTHAQGVRRMGLRRSHYEGLPKTHFQHVLTAVAINLVRIDAWLLGKSPGSTYQSPLALLAAHPLLQQSPLPLQEAC
jgi:transposase